jgi:hypothetical protein
MKYWVRSVVSSSSTFRSPQQHQVDNPFLNCDDNENQFKFKEWDPINVFYYIAIGVSLSLKAVRNRPLLADYVVMDSLQDFWTNFRRPLFSAWEFLQ